MNPFFEFHREALDPQIRENVRKTLPMLDEMKDAELREKVIDAWALSLQLNGWTAIEEMPGSGMPEASAIGDQSMHIKVVMYNALSIYRNLKKAYERDFGLDEDILMACAALHDVGKPYEYNRTERPKWVADEQGVRHAQPAPSLLWCVHLRRVRAARARAERGRLSQP